ncbi:MAG: DEAD/DEAH box helicase [Rikenellaceae bacterium]
MSIEENQFEQLGLSGELLRAIEAKGFKAPTQIQSLVIPKLLEGDGDIIARSQTGTGKTATFGIPILQKIDKSAQGVKAIILVPTRELAIQAADELQSFNAELRLSITAVYGGAAMSDQLKKLAKGVDIVVGTPGRTLDHIRRGTLKLGNIQYLILDEADEMLNMGFVEDVEEIMSHTPEERRVMLFSATMPQRILKLSERYMKDVEIVKIEQQQMTTTNVEQIYYELREADKFDAMTRIIDINSDFYGIVFCRTKMNVDDAVNKLLSAGYAADGLHGDVSQASREKILKKFKAKTINILVATDVAARGIDVNNLTHVINYGLPQDSESYVHRIGRTGRAGNKGTAITFVTKGEMRSFGFMKRDVKTDIKCAELPTAKDIIEMKRGKIKVDMQAIIEGEAYRSHEQMAAELLESYSAEKAVAAMLQLAFKNELDESSYAEIRSFSSGERKDSIRLFIAVGKKDDYTARMITDMLKEKCYLNDSQIHDVSVLENYSFASVAKEHANSVVASLGMNGDRPMAEITRGERGGSRRSDRGDRGGDRGGRSFGGDRRRNEREFSDRGDRGGRRDRSYGGDRDRGGRSDRGDRGGRSDRSDRDSRGAGRSGGREERAPRKEFNRGGGGDSAPKPRREKAPSMMSNEGFDWSMFTMGGNSWDDRGTNKKKKK